MSKQISGIEEMKVNSLDYKSIKSGLMSKGSRRYTNRLTPSTNTVVFRPGQTINFNLPTRGFMDVKNSSIIFTAKGTGDTTIAFNNFIECIINKLEWNLGDSSSKVEFIQQYNLHASAMAKYQISNDYGSTISAIQQGLTDNMQTRNLWCQQGHRYAINLIGSGIMNNNLKYLPLGLLATIGGFSRALQLVLTLEQANQCMIDIEGNVSTRNYEISDVVFMMDIIECPEYEQDLLNQINSGSLVMGIPIFTYREFGSQIPANVQNNQAINYLEYKQYLTGVRTIFKNGVPLSTQEEFTWDFIKPDISEYYWLVNNQQFPNERVRMSAVTGFSESYNELLKYFNKMRTYDKSTLKGLQLNNPDDPSSVLKLDPPSPISPFNIVTFDDPQVCFFTGVTINENWLIDTAPNYKNLQPPNTGDFQVDIIVELVYYTNDGAVGNCKIQIDLYDDTLNTVVNSLIINGDLTILNLETTQTYTLSGLCYLYQTSNYNVRVTLLDTVDNPSTPNARVTVNSSKISAFVINNSSAVENVNEENFIIANTFKTWFDNEDNLIMNGEFLLDGLNTMNNNQLTLLLELASASAQSIGVYTYTDFIRVITIDKNSVQVIE